MLFVNIPVANLERSKAFFAKLGFSYNPAFTDETAACMLVGEHAFVMLLSREKFAEVAKQRGRHGVQAGPHRFASCRWDHFPGALGV
jgi:predicted lactoylglutathione lyase